MPIPYLNEASFVICSLIGGMMHYAKKYLKNETAVSMGQWFGKANWLASVYTLVMFIFVSIGALAGGIINESTSFIAVLYTGFVTGFAIDSGFNSDKQIADEISDARDQAVKAKALFQDDTAHGAPLVPLDKKE
jgi:hypothetical protein